MFVLSTSFMCEFLGLILCEKFQVRGSSTGPPIYEVRLEDAESAEALRRASSVYTRKKSPLPCPPELKGVEVFNCVTLATRVRISILRVGVSPLFTVFSLL